MQDTKPEEDWILKTMQQALSEALEMQVQVISLETNLQEEFELDSIMFVQFLLELEDRISGLRFDPDTLSPAVFSRAQLLVDYIRSQAAAAQ